MPTPLLLTGQIRLTNAIARVWLKSLGEIGKLFSHWWRLTKTLTGELPSWLQHVGGRECPCSPSEGGAAVACALLPKWDRAVKFLRHLTDWHESRNQGLHTDKDSNPSQQPKLECLPRCSLYHLAMHLLCCISASLCACLISSAIFSLFL